MGVGLTGNFLCMILFAYICWCAETHQCLWNSQLNTEVQVIGTAAWKVAYSSLTSLSQLLAVWWKPGKENVFLVSLSVLSSVLIACSRVLTFSTIPYYSAGLSYRGLSIKQ